MDKNEKDEKYNDFLKDLLSEKNHDVTPEPLKPSKKIEVGDNISDFVPKQKEKNIKVKNTVVSDYEINKNKYEEIIMSYLPMFEFYPLNSIILIRPCTVEEIEDFSTYDHTNPLDFKDKLNDILESCVIFKNPDGTLGSYLDIFDGDRIWLIYAIREKTFPKGKTLNTTVTFRDSNNEIKSTKIELNRANMDIWRDQPIMEYLNKDSRVLEIETTLDDKTFKICPPTIGLRNCFDQYLTYKIEENIDLDKKKDIPFFKIAPYLKPNITYMSYDELEEYETWFKTEISPDEYSFLYDLINNHLKIGIKGLKKNMGSKELHTNKMYPDNPRNLFLLPDAFGVFVKK